MRRLRASLALQAALVLSWACSLRSLDHLGAEGNGPRDSGGSGGSAVNGGGGVAGAGVGTAGSAQGGAYAGSTTPAGGENPDPGAAGSAPEIPDCADEQATYDETDLDCGGRTCKPCVTGKRCLTGTDCESAICTNQICQAPTCTDLAVNGGETDLNCGGSCEPCALGQHCLVDENCQTNTCADDMCQSASCEEGVLSDGCPLIVDNTPYSFAPGHAPGRCVDNKALSVAEGNAMILYACKPELHQTFWAVAQADGYFAFRNALSGKCLQVRDANTAENAAIEQSACDYAPEQLWRPSRVDSRLMQLTNKLSELLLDVAGSNVDADVQAIVQGRANGSADTHWHLEKRSTAAYIALSPHADQSLFVRHVDSNVTLSSDDTASAHWKVMPGLADPRYVSFQSRDEPGRYLRHAGFQIWSDTSDGSEQFKLDATFELSGPLVGYNSLLKSLLSFNYDTRRVLRSEDIALLRAFVDSTEYKDAATWWIAPR
jgi:hypothetical protein